MSHRVHALEYSSSLQGWASTSRDTMYMPYSSSLQRWSSTSRDKILKDRPCSSSTFLPSWRPLLLATLREERHHLLQSPCYPRPVYFASSPWRFFGAVRGVLSRSVPGMSAAPFSEKQNRGTPKTQIGNSVGWEQEKKNKRNMCRQVSCTSC